MDGPSRTVYPACVRPHRTQASKGLEKNAQFSLSKGLEKNAQFSLSKGLEKTPS